MSRDRIVPVVKEIGKWIPALLLVLMFATQGWNKFADDGGWAQAFRHWGFPVWFRLAIGVLELSAAALLLWRRTAPLGALLIIVIMVGALVTKLAVDHGRHMQSEVVPIVLSAIVLVTRREQLRALRDSILASPHTLASYSART